MSDSTPPTLPSPGTDPVARLARKAASLLVRRGTLESTSGGGVRLESAALRTAVERQIHAASARDGDAAEAVSPLDARAAAAEVVAGAEQALGRIAGGESPSLLTDRQVMSLEAIVLLTGRPAMRYPGGQVEMPPSGAGENDRWRVFVATARSRINRASESVGRAALDVPGDGPEFAGTVWRIGGDLAVTNRHVAKILAENPDDSPASWRVGPARTCFVDFAVTDAPTAARRFPVAALAFCAEEEEIDLAVLRLDPDGAALPPALALDLAEGALGREVVRGGAPVFEGAEVYVVGHPLRRLPSQASMAVFGQADGRKRCSPGTVTALAPGGPLFEHDCSTLGGNSGSCVLSVDGHAVVGLHYAGKDVTESTGRGSANLAVALSRLGTHRAAAILRDGHA